MLGKSINSIVLLSKGILHISDGGLRLFLADCGLEILNSITSRAANNHIYKNQKPN